jgi:hypothetical protein
MSRLAGKLVKSAPSWPAVQSASHTPGDIVFRHACAMGLEGIVSKRWGSRYRSGRSKDWLKFKNPEAPAVKAGGCGRLALRWHSPCRRRGHDIAGCG